MKKKVILVLICICCSVSPSLAKEEYPTRPIEVVIGYAAGGTTDVLIRFTNPVIEKQLGMPIVVINKPGAAGSLAAIQVSHATPDGYTLLAMPVHFTLFPALLEKPPYSIHDFVAISNLFTTINVLLTPTHTPWKTLDEVIKYARKNPQKLKVGVTGLGSAGNMLWEVIKRQAQIETIRIPLTSEADTLTSALGGHVDIASVGLAVSSPHIKEGRLRALSYTSKTRVPLLRDVPTVVELGYPEANIPSYIGIAGPKGVPKEIVYKISEAYKNAVKNPELTEQFETLGVIPDYLPPDEFQRYLFSSYESFRKIADEAKIRIK